MIVQAALSVKPVNPAPAGGIRHPLAHGPQAQFNAIVGEGSNWLTSWVSSTWLPHEKSKSRQPNWEGHPDNVAPTILGSPLVVGCKVSSRFTAVKAQCRHCHDRLSAYNLKTSDARAVCPELSFKDAVRPAP